MWRLILLVGAAYVVPPRPPPPVVVHSGYGGNDEWSVSVIDLGCMQNMLYAWDRVYTRRAQPQELSHALRWPQGQHPKVCFGLLRENVVCALVQIDWELPRTLRARAVACAPDDLSSGTTLVREMSRNGLSVNWTALSRQPRWYIALLMEAESA